MQIFTNGTMTYTDPTVTPRSDLDENGLPVAVSSDVEKKSVVCTITTLEENKKGYNDAGRYKNCTYSVTFNLDDVTLPFNPTTAVLTHDDKGLLGTFQIQRIEIYRITRTIELWA